MYDFLLDYISRLDYAVKLQLEDKIDDLYNLSLIVQWDFLYNEFIELHKEIAREISDYKLISKVALDKLEADCIKIRSE